MVAMGCGMDEYMELNPELMGILAAADGGLTWSTTLLWLRSFSSLLHFALLLLNQTCNIIYHSIWKSGTLEKKSLLGDLWTIISFIYVVG